MNRNYFFALLFAFALACLTGCDQTENGAENSADNAETSANAPKVKVETSVGDFVITLQPDKAPKTVAQFLENVNSGVYNNSIAHEVRYNYMIQWGCVNRMTVDPESVDSNSADSSDSTKRIPNEATPENSNKKWTVAMLRALDEIESDSVQFFINMKDNPDLDAKQGGENSSESCGYCVFGIVTDGFNTLEAINQTPVVEKEDFEYAPEQDIIITKMSVL